MSETTAKTERRERWRLLLFLSPQAMVAVAMVSLVIYIFTRPGFPPPVYVYSSNRITPTPAQVCPRDFFRYPVTIQIVEAPVAVAIVESIWSVDLERTVVFDEEPFWAAYTTPGTINREFGYLTPHLPPGEYELHSVAQEFGADASGFAVPFTVRGDC